MDYTLTDEDGMTIYAALQALERHMNARTAEVCAGCGAPGRDFQAHKTWCPGRKLAELLARANGERTD